MKYFSVNWSVEFKHVNLFLKYFYAEFMTNWSVHGRKITIFKFDIYLLMTTEKFFVVILGLQGHKRMGKTCAPNMFCFLRHPNVDISMTHHIWASANHSTFCPFNA